VKLRNANIPVDLELEMLYFEVTPLLFYASEVSRKESRH